jgi:hypothetical protein
MSCRMSGRLPPGASCRCAGALKPMCTADGEPIVYDEDGRAYAYDARGRPRPLLPPEVPAKAGIGERWARERWGR